MDPPTEARPHGPRPIQKKHLLGIPPELLDQLGLEIGDEVYVAYNLDLAGTLVVIPAAMISEVWPETVTELRERARKRAQQLAKRRRS